MEDNPPITPNCKEIILSQRSNVIIEIDNKFRDVEKNKNISNLNFAYRLKGRRIDKVTNFLKNNTTITNLNLSYNSINDFGAQKIASVLEKNKSIKILKLCCNDIKSKGVAHLAVAMEQNTTLISLNLSMNLIRDLGAEKIAKALNKNSSIEKLKLSFCGIKNEGAICIADALQVNITVTYLDLEGNYIGAIGTREIADMLNKNKTLKVLQMKQLYDPCLVNIMAGMKENTSLQYLGAGKGAFDNDNGLIGFHDVVFSFLKSNKSISTLDLQRNILGPQYVNSLARGLKDNKTIKNLILAFCEMGDEGVDILASGLKDNTTVQTLDISRNTIGDPGAEKINQLISVNETITTLILLENEIGDHGAEKIAYTLRTNIVITELDLSSNKITYDAGMFIAVAVWFNETLKVLNLADNEISDLGAQAMGKALKTNHTLVSLNLQRNNIGCDGACKIGYGLKVNKSLASLYLCNNNIGNDGIIELAKSLNYNKFISCLDLSDNKFNFGEFAKYFDFKKNKTIKTLKVTGSIANDKECAIACMALRGTTTISHLVMRARGTFNYGPKGLNSIISLLKTNTTITSFFIDYQFSENLRGNAETSAAYDNLCNVLLKNRKELLDIYSKEVFSISDAIRLINCDQECLVEYIEKEKIMNLINKVIIHTKVKVLSKIISTIQQKSIPKESFSFHLLLKIVRYFSISDFNIYFEIVSSVFQNITIDIRQQAPSS